MNQRIPALLALFLGATPLAAQEAALPSLEERVVIASRLSTAISQYFAHWGGTPRGFDPDSAYRRYVREAIGAGTREEFTRASMRYLAAFGNGHTSFRDATLDRRPGGGHAFRTYPIGDDWVVSSSRLEGLRVGDVIRAVDGQPVADWFAGVAPFISSSRDRWTRYMAFRVRALQPGRFTLTLHDGRTVEVTPEGLSPPEEPRVEARWLEEGRLAYVRIPTFNIAGVRDSALAAVKRFASAPAMIVDVRGNGGGTTPMPLMGALMNRPWRWFAEATPAEPGLDRSSRPRSMLRWAPVEMAAEEGAYAGRLAVLADIGCWSACEGFLVPFRDTGRGTILGAATGGSSGQPVFFDLGQGYQFQVSTKREYLPDGGAFEGVGIQPHVTVEPTVEDIRRGRDPVLERARALLAAD